MSATLVVTTVAHAAVNISGCRNGDVVVFVVFVVTVIRGCVRAVADLQVLWQLFCAVA